MCLCVWMETRGKVLERRWWTHLLLSEALRFCRGCWKQSPGWWIGGLGLPARLISSFPTPIVWPWILKRDTQKKHPRDNFRSLIAVENIKKQNGVNLSYNLQKKVAWFSTVILVLSIDNCIYSCRDCRYIQTLSRKLKHYFSIFAQK